METDGENGHTLDQLVRNDKNNSLVLCKQSIISRGRLWDDMDNGIKTSKFVLDKEFTGTSHSQVENGLVQFEKAAK